MRKRVFIILLLFTPFIVQIQAQWTERDSLWLQDILSGEEPIRLNPEIMRAIESGTFLGIDLPSPGFILSPSELPLMRYFPGIAPPDSTMQEIDYSNMPPSVFMRYGPKATLPVELGSFFISDAEREYLHMITPGGLKFCAECFMRYIFWKSERAKVRNRRNANAWRNY